MSIFRFSLLLLVLVVAFTSCRSDHRTGQETVTDKAQIDSSLVRINRQSVKVEEQQIDDFLERYGWDLAATGTGLRYSVYRPGSGAKAVYGNTATLNYSLMLIDGTPVYSSDETGPLQFTVGRGGVESGLEEAILLLRVGDKAKIVIPSHLGYGLLGDQNLIPAKATLIYDVELVELN